MIISIVPDGKTLWFSNEPRFPSRHLNAVLLYESDDIPTGELRSWFFEILNELIGIEQILRFPHGPIETIKNPVCQTFSDGRGSTNVLEGASFLERRYSKQRLDKAYADQDCPFKVETVRVEIQDYFQR